MAPPSVSSNPSHAFDLRVHDIDAAHQTPAQPRFLLSKRGAQSQQKGKQAATPAPHQFASTPRFNLATPTAGRARQQPPPPFSTPAPPPAGRPTRAGPLSDAIDIDSSPVSDDLVNLEDEGQGRPDRKRHPLDESIEIEDSPSSSREGALSHQEADGRPPKRRRVSISPEEEDDFGGDGDDNDAGEPMEVDGDDAEPLKINSTPLAYENTGTSPVQVPAEPEGPRAADAGKQDQSDGRPPSSPPALTDRPQAHATRHPTFRPAPRFKPAEPPRHSVAADDDDAALAARGPPLPEAFSPQRRGAKAYVPGGLAAEVRDWLVQVKGTSEYDRPAGESSGVRVAVEEARGPAGGGMWIVRARGGDGEDEDEGGGSLQERTIILAGDGRLPGGGLAGRNMVGEGGRLKMFQPMWDITLRDLGQFAVACDWELEAEVQKQRKHGEHR